MKHSLPCRALRKRPMKLGTTVILMVSAVLFSSIIQYYGQFLALGLGFMILSPLDAAFGWRNVFIITGVIGIVVVV
ncbi:hypothetical protein MJN51_30840, partial [Salmonella enterica subsp. enterica serovar Kentucky]|nr:hypothetical protein [Salmonella enterica subsp. enterica serovar Kentucky]